MLNNYYDKERQITISEHVEMTEESISEYKRYTKYDAQNKEIYSVNYPIHYNENKQRRMKDGLNTIH